MVTPSVPDDAGADGALPPALLRALQALLEPLAQLAVAQGVAYAQIEAVLKQQLVDAAAAAHPQLPAHRRVSRISTVLGLNRREVTRLTRSGGPAVPARPSATTEVFLRWRTDRSWRDRRGHPKVLMRAGAADSFEALAQSVTQDVHPRSLLDELCRLGLAEHDLEHDTVRLVAQDFVPRGDIPRMLGFLADNVGDHLRAAVGNVLGDGRQHFEQALFADELSQQSIETFHTLVTAAWQHLLDGMVPELERLLEDDRRAGREAPHRLRLGLYTFDTGAAAAPGGHAPQRASVGPGPRARRLTSAAKTPLRPKRPPAPQASPPPGAPPAPRPAGGVRRRSDRTRPTKLPKDSS